MRAPKVLGWIFCLLGLAASSALADTIPGAVPIAHNDSAAVAKPPAEPANPARIDAPAAPSATVVPATKDTTSPKALAAADTAKPQRDDSASQAVAKPFVPPMRGPRGGMPAHGMRGGPPPPSADAAAPPSDVVGIDTLDEDQALEIKLKTDPEAARRYRSPRKAFFMSLMLPGAGQVYCGSWAKAALFASAEVGLGVGWYYVVVVKSRQVQHRAERYAAAHFKLQKYDSTWASLYGVDTATDVRQATSPNRESYCEALYGNTSSSLFTACVDGPKDNATNNNIYNSYSNQFAVGGTSSANPTAWSGDSVMRFWNGNIKNMESFYSLIGYSEFASGWEDNSQNVTTQMLQTYYGLASDNDPSTVASASALWGESAMQQHYLALRARADRLARSQKWFMGGMILNHLAAAFDAALQAGRMNRKLLDVQTTWLDGLDVQGGLAWAGGLPVMQGRLAWSF
jgi:hypothetical protein